MADRGHTRPVAARDRAIELDQTIAAALPRCRAAWPGLDVPAQAFAEFVAERMPARRGPDEFVSSVAITDLYLACGCAVGDEVAAAAFRQHFAPVIAAVVARFAVSADFADELLHDLYCRLFLPPDRRIAGYQGEGPLDTWVRVVAARMAIDAVRRQARQSSLTDSLELRLERLEDDADSILLEHSVRQHLKLAFEQASRVLTGRERAVLRYSLDGATADEVARVYGVHRVSVARWLGAIRAKLKAAICEQLTAQLELTRTGVERAVLSIDQITLSLDRLLPRS